MTARAQMQKGVYAKGLHQPGAVPNGEKRLLGHSIVREGTFDITAGLFQRGQLRHGPPIPGAVISLKGSIGRLSVFPGRP
jgi:hypothetical protein